MTESVINKCKQAVDFYIESKSIQKTARKFKIRNNYLSMYLKSIGIEVINHQNITNLDETVFDVIDSEEKAYWLGFLYADGYISKRDNAVELSLQLTDYEHLEKFMKFLKRANTVKTDSFRCRLSFTNKHIHNQLINLGCTTQKSLTLTFPNKDIIPKHLLKDFVRGYVDGDGCIYIFQRKTAKIALPGFNILGTEAFLKSLQKEMNWRRNKIYKKLGQEARTINYAGYYVIEMLDALYKDSTIYLNRKYEKYLKLQNVSKNAPIYSDIYVESGELLEA